MGKSPMTSIQGSKYIPIMYVYGTNAILALTLKSRSIIHILESYTKNVEQLTNIGYRPRVYYMDNEASDSLKKY